VEWVFERALVLTMQVLSVKDKNSIRLRLILPVSVFILTIALLYWGHVEEQEFWYGSHRVPESDGAHWGLRLVWDYMPAGRRLAYMISFPAALVDRSLLSYLDDRAQFGPGPWHLHVPFVLVVLGVWYWLGRGLDRYRGMLPYDARLPRGIFLSGSLWIGVLASALVLAMTIRAVIQGYVPIATLSPGAFVWSVGLSVYFVRQLHRRPFRRKATT
jgi:hypothetical protein